MPNNIQKANLPLSPFDGQEYVDFRGVKWKFLAKDDCWRSAGVASDEQLASAEQTGLLSPTFKRLLDSLPDKAGGFGIITKPLLSVVPLRRKPAFKGTVVKAFESPSGSAVQISSKEFTTNQYAGKLIFFTSGVLKSTYYVIFTNSDDTIYIMGKESSTALKGDKFEIIEAGALNEHGVIQGDIKLVSETLDIACVTGNGDNITTSPGCPPNRLFVDDPNNPPGIDIKVNSNFLDQFCVSIPGCTGPEGDKGAKGPKGKDGTGDGPQGVQGEAGADAPAVGHTFTGVKINDIDDIYDTAIVAFELDAAAGKLHVVKAKIKVPNDSMPAERIIANAVNRDLLYTGNDFDYEILMPTTDPINVANVELMHYPESFVPESTEAVRTNRYDPNVVKLSKFIDALNQHFKMKLSDASVEYDKNIKPFIEKKDEEARKILSELADDVAKCEWDTPIEFCLGIGADNCNPSESESDVTPFPLAEAVLGSAYAGAVTTPPTEYSVKPKPKPPPPPNKPPPGDQPPPPEPTDPYRNKVPGTREPEDAVPGDPVVVTVYPDRPYYPGEEPIEPPPNFPVMVPNPVTGELEEKWFPWQLPGQPYPGAPNQPGGLPIIRDRNGNPLSPIVETSLYNDQINDINSTKVNYKPTAATTGTTKIGPNQYTGTGTVKVYDYKGSALIQPSTLFFTYKKGAARGDTAYTADVTIKYYNEGGSGETVLLSSDNARLHDFSFSDFEKANQEASAIETSASVVLTSPSEVYLELLLPSERGTVSGEIVLEMRQVFTSENALLAPMPITQTLSRDKADQGTSGSNPQCPDCPDFPDFITILNVSPYYYDIAGGETGEVVGSGFSASDTILINNSPVATTFVSATKLQFVTNPLPDGVYDLVVAGENNVASAPNSVQFIDTNATSPATPVVTNIGNAYGDPAGSYTVTITGTNFGTQGTGSSVVFGTQDCTISSWSDTSIIVIVPASLGSTNVDPVDVIITTAEGATTTEVNGFTYYVDTDIQSVSPTSISSAAGGNITINGTYFGSTQGTVVISNLTTPAAPVTLTISSWNDTTIVASIAIGTPVGQYSLTVTRNDNRDSEINSPSIRITP